MDYTQGELTKEELQWIIWKAEQSIVAGGNLDVNHTALDLVVAAKTFLALLDMPNHRPIQERYDLILKTMA